MLNLSESQINEAPSILRAPNLVAKGTNETNFALRCPNLGLGTAQLSPQRPQPDPRRPQSDPQRPQPDPQRPLRALTQPIHSYLCLIHSYLYVAISVSFFGGGKTLFYPFPVNEKRFFTRFLCIITLFMS